MLRNLALRRQSLSRSFLRATALCAIILALLVTRPVSIAGTGELTLLSSTVFNGSSDLVGTGIAYQSNGLYFSGVSTVFGDLEAIAGQFAAPLANNAAPAWSKVWPNAGGFDAFMGVDAGSDGVYYAGSSYSQTADAIGGKERKEIVAKFNLNGAPGPAAGGAVWVGSQRFYPGSNSYDGDEFFNAARVSVEGGVTYLYGAGHAQSNGCNNNTAIRKYTSAGAMVWQWQYVTSACGGSDINAIAVDGTSVYAAGSSGTNKPQIIKFDAPSGVALATFESAVDAGFASGAYTAATSLGGNIYAVGYLLNGEQQSYLLDVWTPAGVRTIHKVWSSDPAKTNGQQLTGITAVGLRLFAVGWTRNTDSTAVAHNMGGNTIPNFPNNSSYHGFADAVIFEVNPANGAVISTTSYGTNDGRDQAFTGVTTDGTDLYVVGAERNAAGVYHAAIQRYGITLPTSMTAVNGGGTYGATGTASATLTAGGGAVVGATVNFSLFGTPVGSAITDGSGKASITGISLAGKNAGSYGNAVTASFTGTGSFLGSSGSGDLVIGQAPATITVSGAGAFMYDGQSHAASATVTGVFNESLGPASITYTNLADSTTGVAAPSNPGTYRINASYAGSSNYLAGVNSSNTITIVALDSNAGDVAVDVGGTKLSKLRAADGTVAWSVNRNNCGGLAVDQGDFGVYTASAPYCSGGGAGAVHKYSAAGALLWSTPYSGCGVSGNYYVGTGGIAVDTTSSTPGVVLAKSGYYGDIGKVSRSSGATLFCDGTNDVGRPTIDPANGQIYALTNAGPNYNYNTLYSLTANNSSIVTTSSCEGVTELNPADRMFYRAGRSCGANLAQLNKGNLGGAPNWSLNVGAMVASIDAIAVQPWADGYIYLASGASSKIVVVDPATQNVVRTFSTAVAPYMMAASPATGTIFVSNSAVRVVYAYNPAGVLLWVSPDLGGPVYNLATPRNLIGSPVVYSSPSTTNVTSSMNPSTFAQSVTFTATVSATGGTATGTVTFKDGGTTLGTGTLSGGTATFTTSALAVGSHSITASYSGAAGFDSSTSSPVTQTVNPAPPPTAAIAASPNPAACSQSVTFDGTGSHASPGLNIGSYAWSFGDGAIANGATATHAYSAFGTYTATLTVTDNNTPPQTDTESLVVQVNQGNMAPVALPGGPYLVDLGMPLLLNGAGSSDPNTGCGDSIASYSWSINNGAILLTGAQPTLTAAQIAALGAGAFTVSLKVTDSFGAIGSTSTTLSIYNNVPTASFTAAPNPAACSAPVVFDGAASAAGRPDRAIVTYAWNFGDGSTASGVTATHAYAAFGSYTATLTVTDNNAPAKTASMSTVVNVNQGNRSPIASHGGPYLFDLGTTAALDGTGSTDPDASCGDSIKSYAWSINNGAIVVAGAQPMLTAAQIAALGTGTFPVWLTVTDSFGAVATANTTLSIYNNVPTAAFSANPNPAACGQAIAFDATSSAAGRPDRHIVSYQWNFGDNTTANGATVTHAYGTFGTFVATLTVTDDNVPPKTDSQTVAVNASLGNMAPIANHGGPYSVNQGAAVTLNGGGSVDPNAGCGDHLVSYDWTIDGQYHLSGPSPALDTAITALSAGSHQLVLTVTDSFGVSGSASTTINVQRVLVSIAVTPSPVTLQRGQHQMFTATGTFSDGSTEPLMSGGNGGGGGGGFFGPNDPAWQVQFLQMANFEVCSTPEYPLNGGNGSWSSQNLLTHGGNVDMTWSAGTPVVHVSGAVSLNHVHLDLACTNAAAFGSIDATWTGTRYEGTLTFNLGATQSAVSITGWSRKTDMPSPRFGLTALAANGKVYAIGGAGGSCSGNGPCQFGPLTNVDVYDPLDETWSAGPPLNQGREGGRALALGNTLYVIGGHVPGGQASGIVETLDLNGANTWSVLASDPMPTARANFALVTDGTYLYAIGGDSTANNGGQLSTVERFDPAAPAGQRWTTLLSMPVAGNFIGAGVLNGTIVVAGAGGTNRTDIYDIAANTWSPGVPMPAQRAGMASAVANGGLWLIGGTTNGSLNYDTWVYYPQTNMRPAGWAGVGSMPTGRSTPAAAVIDDVIYAVGGADASNAALASNEALSTPPFDSLSTGGGNGGGSGDSLSVQWSSTNAAAASIDGGGNATALAIGQTTIVASAGNVSCETTQTCATLTVANTVPAVQIFGGPFTTTESTNFQNFSTGGNFSDPDLQQWTATVDYGDGSGAQPLALFNLQNGFGQFSLAHTYTDNGAFTITVTIDDHAGGIGTATTQVTVSNRAPQVSGPNSARTSTGSAQMLGCISFFDVATDAPWMAKVNYGDGSGDQDISVNVGGSCGGGGSPTGAFNLSHVYASGGTFTVTAMVTDKDQGTGSWSFPVTVNAPPSVLVDNTPLASINEGSMFTGTASFTDASGDGPWTVRITYGDNSGQLQSTVNSVGAIPLSHVYKDNGSYTITVQVTDSFFASASATAQLQVNNVAPTVANLPAVNAIAENQQVNFTVNFSDPGVNDTQSPGAKANINWGDGSSQTLNVFANNGNGSFFVNHQYRDNPAGGGAFTISVTVTDKDGATSAAQTTQLVVNNQAPDLQLNGFPQLVDGAAATFNGQLFDAGSLDAPWTGTVDFGDGTSQPLTFALNPAGQSPRGAFSFTHTYHLSGQVTLRLTATDKDGATSTRTLSLFVEPALLSVTISPTSAWIKTIGQSLLFNATGHFSDGSTQSTNGAVIDEVTWSSSNPNAATVGAGGLATAVAAGTTTITVVVHDDLGHTFSAQSTLIVDVTAPVITASNITVEATSAAGAMVTLAYSATDDFDPAPAVSADHASGLFPLGQTPVVITARDAAGNPSTLTIYVKVVDTTAPALTVPANITVDATSPAGAVVTYVVSATDAVTASPVITCGVASGSVFAIGTTETTCTATDAAGNAATGNFTVTVRGAAAQVANLIDSVVALNLAAGIENSLDAKLQNVSSALNSMSNRDIAGACGQLAAFINEVAAQAGKKIAVERANQLIAAAQQIRSVIGC